jgi:hypothetical protein
MADYPEKDVFDAPFTRRGFFVALVAPVVVPKLITHPLLTFEPKKLLRPPTMELSGLGREFLLGGFQRTLTCILGGGAVTPREIRPGARMVLTNVVERLGIADRIKELLAGTEEPEGDLITIGGPINNDFARALLGHGLQSPLFRIIETGERAKPPVSFDISDLQGTWELVVRDGEHETRFGEVEDEFLLITSIPDPYQEDARLLNIATQRANKHPLTELVLSNPHQLAELIDRTRHLAGWQALFRVRNGQEVVEERIFPINIDFDALRNLLVGKPHLSDLRFPETATFAGLLAHDALGKAYTPHGRVQIDSLLDGDPATTRNGLLRSEDGPYLADPNPEQAMRDPNVTEVSDEKFRDSDTIASITNRRRDELSKLKKAVDAKWSKADTVTPAQLELASKYVFGPEQLSANDLDQIDRILIANPKLRADIDELVRHKRFLTKLCV